MTREKPLPSNVVAIELNSDSAIRIIRSIVSESSGDSARVFFTPHAESQMVKRGITRPQVIRCLRHGKVAEGPARSAKGNWEVAIEVFSAGEPVRVVAALDYDDGDNIVIVITAYKI